MDGAASDIHAEHVAEMGRRRTIAVEREDDGPVFAPESGRDDGRFSWVLVAPILYNAVLAHARWRHGPAPGARTDRIQVAAREQKKVIFRLRGLEPSGLAEAMRSRTVLIGEYWPNDQSESFRGVNLVMPDPRRWRQDLIPQSETVFLLTLEEDQLWLFAQADLRPPRYAQLKRTSRSRDKRV